MTEADPNPFAYGSTWLRADFHLHTKADKEFSYDGEENAFGTAYVNRLKAANIGLGVISNHNKFDADEFKALRRRAGKEGIGLLPSVELSVNDGANGVHTVIVVFSEQWLEGGHDYINQFLNVAFTGRTPAQYEHENARTNDDLLQTLKKLEGYNRDFFIIFAHVVRADGKTKVMTLDADEFIRRFLLHALPDGFHRIRHYGFLANGSRGDSLARCRRLLKARATSAVHEPAHNHTQGDCPLTAADFAICPDCGGTMRRIAVVPRSCNSQPFSCDTS
jgi:hypothetical protein